MIVWMDTEHYDYYQKRLTDADAETLQTVIDRYTQGAEGSKRQTAILREVRADSVTVEHITLLNSALEEDLRTLRTPARSTPTRSTRIPPSPSTISHRSTERVTTGCTPSKHGRISSPRSRPTKACASRPIP